MCISFLLVSCGKDSVVSYVPVTGWVIGTATDEDTGIPTPEVLKTTNGGATWTLQSLPAECVGFQGNDISAVNHQVAWAAIGDLYSLEGGIVHTLDGGATWAMQTLPDGMGNRHIKGIKGVSAMEAWAVSIGGDVLHTTDGGNNWYIVPTRTVSGEVITMTMVNRMDVTDSNIWIVDVPAHNMGVIHSPDGGQTWRHEQLPDVGSGHGPLAISAFSSLVAYVSVNSEGTLWWTSNGGESWNKSVDAISGTADFDEICASSTNVVWVAMNNGGSSGGLAARITVTDGSFDSNIYMNVDYMMEGISAMNDTNAWLVGFKTFRADPSLPKGAIYVTYDGGVNWQLQTLPDNACDIDLWKVSFVGARR